MEDLSGGLHAGTIPPGYYPEYIKAVLADPYYGGRIKYFPTEAELLSFTSQYPAGLIALDIAIYRASGGTGTISYLFGNKNLPTVTIGDVGEGMWYNTLTTDPLWTLSIEYAKAIWWMQTGQELGSSQSDHWHGILEFVALGAVLYVAGAVLAPMALGGTGTAAAAGGATAADTLAGGGTVVAADGAAVGGSYGVMAGAEGGSYGVLVSDAAVSSAASGASAGSLLGGTGGALLDSGAGVAMMDGSGLVSSMLSTGEKILDTGVSKIGAGAVAGVSGAINNAINKPDPETTTAASITESDSWLWELEKFLYKLLWGKELIK